MNKNELRDLYKSIKNIAIERKWCPRTINTPPPITMSPKCWAIRIKPKLMCSEFRRKLTFFGYVQTLKYLKEIILFEHPEYHNRGYKLCISNELFTTNEKIIRRK